MPPSRRRGPSGGRRQRPSLGRRVAAWTSVVVVAVLVAGVLGAYAKYRGYWDSIQRVDVKGGFEKIINDLGGVNVCLPVAVDDPLSGLNLSAGVHHVFGREALAFWRTREDLGDGSDLERITRDQYLMAALVQGIEHSGLLGSPSRMLKVVGDATGAMATDTGLDQNTMLQIAESLRGVTTGSVQFITAPNVPWPPNANDVEFEQPQAGELFSTISTTRCWPRRRRRPRSRPRPPRSTPSPRPRRRSPLRPSLRSPASATRTGASRRTPTSAGTSRRSPAPTADGPDLPEFAPGGRNPDILALEGE